MEFNLACQIQSWPLDSLEETDIRRAYYISDDWVAVHYCHVYGQGLLYIEPGQHTNDKIVLYCNWTHIAPIPREKGRPSQAIFWKGKFFKIKIVGNHMSQEEAAFAKDNWTYYKDGQLGHALDDRLNFGHNSFFGPGFISGIAHHPKSTLDYYLKDPFVKEILEKIKTNSMEEEDYLVFSDWLEDKADKLANSIRELSPADISRFTLDKLLFKMTECPTWRTFRLLLLHSKLLKGRTYA